VPIGQILAFSAPAPEGGGGTRCGWLYCLADPTVDERHTSLLEVVTGHDTLWTALRGENVHAVAVPVLGSGFARARLSFEGLQSPLLLSFHAASLGGTVVRTLHVCVQGPDFSPRLLAEAARQLRSLGYEQD
jgi:hypothetical protein